MKRFSTRMIVIIGVLSALGVILRLLAIPPGGAVRLEFSSIPIAIAAQMYGPIAGGLSALVTDLLGTVVVGQTPLPLITVSKVIMGVLFGIFLWKKRSLARVSLCMTTVLVVVDILIMGLILSNLYGSPFIPTMISRLPFNLVLLATRIIILSNRPIGKMLDYYRAR